MRNGRSIKCNKGGREGAAPTTEREFDVDDIHGKKGERERGEDVSQHSQSYKFQEPYCLDYAVLWEPYK